jgi:hypothetical protein
MTLGFLQFLFIPVVFGCAAWSVARGKNRNPVPWFVLGLIIGPIASVILLFLKAGPGKDQGYQ